jgi:coproporphyrinogen III oxidase-like Fe-S oxidoreductase
VGDDCTYLNARDREDYVARVARGGLPIKHWATLDARQKATRDVTFALMYAPFIDVGKARRRYGEESVTAMDPVLRRWADLGLGSYDGDLFFPTSDGKLLHLQMVPMLYDARRDSGLFDGARLRRKAAGRAYRGY